MKRLQKHDCQLYFLDKQLCFSSDIVTYEITLLLTIHTYIHTYNLHTYIHTYKHIYICERTDGQTDI